ncbi:hypothetical protein B0J13DRAFT_563559 [Dactylonectria estremocensis]|uniref:Uncharacterized protein n=1 Tax=Dactylonectria estremocensis TaxID=1079267 RepID=A0A9P9E392_9HYPO|nr:hypothetical protein B0J13DRAFT_563559 [Dactylonectria estremocensis]
MSEAIYLDEKKYQDKCRHLTPQALRDEETLHIKRKISCGWGVWFSLGAAAKTSGIALPFAALNLRRRQVCSRKLEIIKRALLNRSLQPKEVNRFKHEQGSWLFQVFCDPMWEFMELSEPSGTVAVPAVGADTVTTITQQRPSSPSFEYEAVKYGLGGLFLAILGYYVAAFSIAASRSYSQK